MWENRFQEKDFKNFKRITEYDEENFAKKHLKNIIKDLKRIKN